MYDSQENKASQQHIVVEYDTPVGIPEPDFVMQTVSNIAAFDCSLLSQHQTQQKYDENSNKESKYQKSLQHINKEDNYQESLIKQRKQDKNMIISNLTNIMVKVKNLKIQKNHLHPKMSH